MRRVHVTGRAWWLRPLPSPDPSRIPDVPPPPLPPSHRTPYCLSCKSALFRFKLAGPPNGLLLISFIFPSAVPPCSRPHLCVHL